MSLQEICTYSASDPQIRAHEQAVHIGATVPVEWAESKSVAAIVRLRSRPERYILFYTR
jgi:hypothetical protein